MKWYRHASRFHMAAARPPAYLMERMSDLYHAAEISRISPGRARDNIRSIISQFHEQSDDDYANSLAEAENIILDSPAGARAIIHAIIESMIDEKEQHEMEKKSPWLA